MQRPPLRSFEKQKYALSQKMGLLIMIPERIKKSVLW